MKKLLLTLVLCAAAWAMSAQELHNVKYLQPSARNYGVLKSFVVVDSFQLKAGAAVNYVLQCSDTFGNARWAATVAGGDTSLWEYRAGILQPKANTPVQAIVYTDSVSGYIGFGMDTSDGPNSFGIISYDSATGITHILNISSRDDADGWRRDSAGAAGDFALSLNSNGFVFGTAAGELLRLNRSGLIIRNGTGSTGDVLTRNSGGFAGWAPPADGSVTGSPNSIPYIGADDTLVTTNNNLTYDDALGVFQANLEIANCTINTILAFYDTSNVPEFIFTEDGRTGMGGFPSSAKLFVTNTPQPGINQVVVTDTDAVHQFVIDAHGNVMARKKVTIGSLSPASTEQLQIHVPDNNPDFLGMYANDTLLCLFHSNEFNGHISSSMEIKHFGPGGTGNPVQIGTSASGDYWNGYMSLTDTVGDFIILGEINLGNVFYKGGLRVKADDRVTDCIVVDDTIFSYVTGAKPGYVLTCLDTFGNSAWQPRGMWQQYADSVIYYPNSNDTVFLATNDDFTGTGKAAFMFTNQANENAEITRLALVDSMEFWFGYASGMIPKIVAPIGTINFYQTNQILPYETSDVSNPPTDAELDALFGTPATVGDGFTSRVKDSNSNNFYTVVAVGSAWYTTSASLAP